MAKISRSGDRNDYNQSWKVGVKQNHRLVYSEMDLVRDQMLLDIRVFKWNEWNMHGCICQQMYSRVRAYSCDNVCV